MRGSQTITPAQLRARLEGSEEFAILDVRREGDFSKDHLFFACNIPRSQLELRIERLLPRRDIPIIISATGEGADDVEEALRTFGYGEISYLEEGLAGWTKSGGKLFSGVNVPSKAFGEFVEIHAGTPHVGPKALKELLKSEPDSVLLDCRPASEYEAISIPGAVNRPGVELVYRFFSTVPNLSTRVYVNCAGRTRSIIGAQSLIDAGVKNPVAAVRDGAMGWKLAGYPLERGAKAGALPIDAVFPDFVRTLIGERLKRAQIRAISAQDCHAFLSDSSRTTYLFDVRDPSEYDAGHIERAISAPGGQLLQTFDAFVAAHNARIILADSDGVRAPTAALWLKQMGVRNLLVTSEAAGRSLGAFPSPELDRLIAGAPTISASKAEAILRTGGGSVFDLATSKEYRNCHISGARFVERHQLRQELDGLSARCVFLTSVDGRLARVAAMTTKIREGVTHFAIDGGTAAWREAGLPVETGEGTLPPSPSDVFYRPYDKAENVEAEMRAYLEWEMGLVDRVRREPGVRFSRLAP